MTRGQTEGREEQLNRNKMNQHTQNSKAETKTLTRLTSIATTKAELKKGVKAGTYIHK